MRSQTAEQLSGESCLEPARARHLKLDNALWHSDTTFRAVAALSELHYARFVGEASVASEDYDSLDSLCRAYRSGSRLSFLFFWGHTTETPERVGKECLSQWYPAPFVLDGYRFPTAEHYMMFRKATLFDDNSIAERILEARTPDAVKALGRSVRRFDHGVWEHHRSGIVVAGNCAKFSQNGSLLEFLRGTGERILVEASPLDRVWGIGLGADDTHAANPLKWQGLNLLGFALMNARNQLQ